MSRTWQVIIGLVVIAVIAAGAYAIMHRSTTSAPTTTASTTGAIIQTKSNANLGSYLVDAKGHPLYTYEKDTSGVSNCTNACLTNWPAYLVSGSGGSLPAHVGTIKRADGATQYTYDGMPLYTFSGDSQAGSVTGDGSEGFHIAKPAGSAAAQTAPPAPAPTPPAPAPAPTPAPSAAPQPAPAPAPAPAPSPSPYNY